MKIKRITVVTGGTVSEAVEEMLELSQEHDCPVTDDDLNVTVYPLDSADSAVQRAEVEHEND